MQKQQVKEINSMSYHPLMVNWQHKRITVIGGGIIAERKIKSFLEQGAIITVISPFITDELSKLVENKIIRWKEKKYDQIDTEDALFIIAATNNVRLNEEIVNRCKQHQLTLNVSNHLTGNTIMPATIKRKHLQIAISTNGASPIVAQKIRNHISQILDEQQIEEEITTIAEKRKAIIGKEENAHSKQKQLHALTDILSLE